MTGEIPDLNPHIVDALHELANTDHLRDETVKHLTLGPEATVVYPAKKLEKADDVMDSGHLQQVWDIVEDLQNKGMSNEEIKKFLYGVADGIEDN